MKKSLAEICVYLSGELIGDGETAVTGVNSTEGATSGDITFAQNEKYLKRALNSEAAAIVVGPQVTDLKGFSGIRVDDPKAAFVRLLYLFHPETKAVPGIHPSAVIGEGVKIGDRVCIKANAVIGDHVVIGPRSIIGAGVSVESNTIIGSDCVIYANVSIYSDTVIGDRVRIHSGSTIGGDGFGYIFREGKYIKVPQVGNVVIENDVELGCNVCVDCATVGSTIIREGSKIDNQVQIAHNNHIGRHVTMSGQAGLAGSVFIDDYCILGGKAGVVDHVHIGKGAKIGAASVVTRNVAEEESVWGYPARATKETMKQMAAIAHLPKWMEKLRRLFKGKVD